MQKTLSLVLGAAITLGSSFAGAQELNTSAAPASSATTTGGSVTDTSGITDHAVVTGHWALRYFGTTNLDSLPHGTPPAASSPLAVIGARYWLNGSLGIEAGLAIGFNSATSQTTTNGTALPPNDDPNFFGFGLHAALPIMLAEAKHVSVHLDPYLEILYGHSGISTSPDAQTNEDKSLNAFRLGLGANATAELQFGFLGIPQLGLQASIGFGLNYRSTSTTTVRTTTATGQTPRTETIVSTSGFGLGTTVGPGFSLSEIITGSLSAVWYFGGAPSR